MTDLSFEGEPLPKNSRLMELIRERREKQAAEEAQRQADLAFFAEFVPDLEPTFEGDDAATDIFNRVEAFRHDNILAVYDQLVRGHRSSREHGEVSAQCPVRSHEDLHPSASIQADKGLWFCHRCYVGGSVFDMAGAAWGYQVPLAGPDVWDVKKQYASKFHGLDVDAALGAALGGNASIGPQPITASDQPTPIGTVQHTATRPDASGDLDYERQVARRLRQLQVDDEARARLRRSRGGRVEAQLDLAYTFADLLGEPNEAVRYTIDRLALKGGNTLLLGDSKTGKTEAVLDLLKALVDGRKFYGEFAPRSIQGNICYLNFEVDKATFRHRMSALGIVNVGRLRPIAVRGKRFDLLDSAVFANLAQQLRKNEIEVLVADPWRRYFGGDDENNAVQVDRYLNLLDELKEASGTLVDVFLTCHTPKAPDRFKESARGSSAIENWYDNLWVFRKEQETDGSYRRFFRLGVGRDADQEGLMGYVEVVRGTDGQMRLARPGAGVLSAEELKVYAYIEDNPGCNKSDVRRVLSLDQKRCLKIVDRLSRASLVMVEKSAPGQEHALWPC